jgi:guanine deaminase
VKPAPFGELLRAPLFHTPRNPFVEDRALEYFSDGGLLIQEGRVAGVGDFSAMQAAHSGVATVDMRGGFLLPGLVDTHIHFPQVRVLGSLGGSLLDWLRRYALPEETKMADVSYACQTAQAFLHGLVSHGTTTALVFGAHFAAATAALFEAAKNSGLRIVSGLAMSDRGLRPELQQLPESAYRDSVNLIGQFHSHGRMLYAVSPRFALSASEAMLEVCQTLMREYAGLRFQTHINENRHEIEQVAKLFPWAKSYLHVYERFGLCNRAAVLAHNVHPSNSELESLAASGATIAHCPSSNAALASGVFPLRRHIRAGVRCSLGTDVGAGIGFGLLREALQAYLMQRVSPNGFLLEAGHLLYLITRAGAEALSLEGEIGDFSQGKAADFVYIRPPADSPLAEVLSNAESEERILGALFTMAGAESVRQVRVEGKIVYQQE